jgi:hypothetical protein
MAYGTALAPSQLLDALPGLVTESDSCGVQFSLALVHAQRIAARPEGRNALKGAQRSSPLIAGAEARTPEEGQQRAKL